MINVSLRLNLNASSAAGSSETVAGCYLKHVIVSLLNYGMANYILVVQMKRKSQTS